MYPLENDQYVVTLPWCIPKFIKTQRIECCELNILHKFYQIDKYVKWNSKGALDVSLRNICDSKCRIFKNNLNKKVEFFYF